MDPDCPRQGLFVRAGVDWCHASARKVVCSFPAGPGYHLAGLQSARLTRVDCRTCTLLPCGSGRASEAARFRRVYRPHGLRRA